MHGENGCRLSILEMKRGPYVYEYRALEDIPEKFLQNRLGRMFTKALSAVEGRCARCARNATVPISVRQYTLGICHDQRQRMQ